MSHSSVPAEHRCRDTNPGQRMTRTVAILGATGLVGRTTRALLEERDFPLARLVLLASERSEGRREAFRGESLPVDPVSAGAFAGVDLALFAVTNPLAEQWAPVARAAGTRVI